MKPLIQRVILNFEIDTYLNDQLKWELLKYEIRKFPINFSGKLANTPGTLQTDLGTKIKNLEQNLTKKDKFNEYETAKDELENVFDDIAAGVKIRSKCDWYQYGEKSTNYFLNLKKQKAVNGTVKEIIKNDIKVNDQLKIQHISRMFYE